MIQQFTPIKIHTCNTIILIMIKMGHNHSNSLTNDVRHFLLAVLLPTKKSVFKVLKLEPDQRKDMMAGCLMQRSDASVLSLLPSSSS